VILSRHDTTPIVLFEVISCLLSEWTGITHLRAIVPLSLAMSSTKRLLLTPRRLPCEGEAVLALVFADETRPVDAKTLGERKDQAGRLG
jgi:hypothetical protein